MLHTQTGRPHLVGGPRQLDGEVHPAPLVERPVQDHAQLSVLRTRMETLDAVLLLTVCQLCAMLGLWSAAVLI